MTLKLQVLVVSQRQKTNFALLWYILKSIDLAILVHWSNSKAFKSQSTFEYELPKQVV